jgi:hypothetical protein
MKNKYSIKYLAGLLLGFGSATVAAQPTVFNYTGTVQTYTVPAGMTAISIEAIGAQGGASGGLGANMYGEFTVTPGQVLNVIVGQEGQLQIGGNFQNSAGGGGGSFVYDASNVLFIAAAGGGGKCPYTSAVPLHADAHGKATPDGGQNSDATSFGGTGGNGGQAGNWSGSDCAGGGTGWLTPGGGGILGGLNAPTWAAGNPYCAGGGGGCGGYGGFGGGGGAGNLYGGGGGGGGYSGGAGGNDPDHGGGGGSYNNGINQVNIGGVNSGNGQVTITPLCAGLTTSVSATTICQGDFVTLSATSTNGGTVTWDSGVIDNVPFQINAAGTSTFIATSDNAMDCEFTVNIIALPTPVFTVSTSDDFGNNDGGVYLTFTDAVFPLAYDWNNDGTGDFDDAQNLTNVGSGTYTVVVQNGNGCTSTASATVISQLGIEANTLSFSAYPNPATDQLVVSCTGAFNYQIMDVSGKLVFSGNGSDKIIVPVSTLASGSYVIMVTSNAKTGTMQFVKK